ncbi:MULTISPECIES: tyrosine-type recombinase/integrase [unclassified Ruminococcus]|uniref:tyrosine-type recombinase/integrase n=1 Tax=unclassified Ruminococcus TaxID=2608920 RepID=UPI00210CF3E9|nr:MULTISPECIES: tyrosine-type recombinase/integrase [unclassified Ruminococcus]MCQ4023361.1 tyrosine-type recombinase/integrase [Ruminococcus sp. zg-924]MCQ4115706.1 tyrosine-type recombinase/integrase [Ruminococcus sp. zg-921]
MKNKSLSKKSMSDFQKHLIQEEKSSITIEKYMHDVKDFYIFVNNRVLTKDIVIEYKSQLTERYAVRSVNSKLASLNSLLAFLNREDCKVKSLKLQREIYSAEERELTKSEYLRLLQAAKNNPRLHLIIETICGTGIRVSELRYFTVEGVQNGTISVRCKGKTRNILVPSKLRKLLLRYAKLNKIVKGIIFRTRNGKPVNRSNIWSEMKKLCKAANVNPQKVFPHNLRKLFARTFYGIEKDIAKLADILGHSSIDTTRIYIMSTGTEHRRRIDRLGLVV